MLRHRVIAVVYSALVVAALLSPPAGGPHSIPHLDKVLHALAFAGAGWVWLRAGAPGWLVLAAGVLVGGGTELAQGVLPWKRSPEWHDLAADLVGLVAGLALGSWRNGRDSNPR